MKRFIFGFTVGFVAAGAFIPRMLRNILTENRLISDNGHIERNKKLMATITKNQLTKHEHRNNYPNND